ncbi:MAG: hypothetical protein KIH63_001425 [Candidatus Saccharibacteria bacterium]|nr:hypothetical protein [Candidatus Saccharibacteria bacterium]
MRVTSFENTAVAVTVMRHNEAFGADPTELEDGNMIPRLCAAVGAGVCARACQLEGNERAEVGKACAENNIAAALESFGVQPEQFVLAGATKDIVRFGDSLSIKEVKQSSEGYSQVPDTNAFFFRPGIDTLPNGNFIEATGMRMADCGAVNYQLTDHDGNQVVGMAHFSRTNMRGPSKFEHTFHDEQASWSDTVIGSALEHYQADPSSVSIYVSAAVEGKDFIHHYDNVETMEEHYPGWNELGFMHPLGDQTEDFDCLIDYREMIGWQLEGSAHRFGFTLHDSQLESAINTGDLLLGHASHHAATHDEIAHGRDLYMVKGTSPIDYYQLALETAVANEIVRMPLEAGMPQLDQDPFVALYQLRMGHAPPPRQLWDTPDIREAAEAEGFHPMTYWLMDSEVPSASEMYSLYAQWLEGVNQAQQRDGDSSINEQA